MIRIAILLLLLCNLPGTVEAAITFNEIAWMGDSESPNHEWIELYNDGQSIDVNGWTITDDDSLLIKLSGIIQSASHVVLERTSDESAPGEAFLIYTGALKNTGTTLTLRRSDGGVEDQVSSGADWASLGGDNTTKATAQYTTSGWITAEPTPGRANTNQAQIVETTNSETPKSTGSARLAEPVPREEKKLILPGSTLELSVNAAAQVFVNQPVEFSIDSRGVGKTIESSLQVFWNFGDTNSALGKKEKHAYEFPGRYIVVVTAEFAGQSSQATHEVTVLPVSLSLTKNSTGDIQINNDSQYIIDISNYRLRADDSFDFPLHTKLLPLQTITVPMKKIGSVKNRMVALYDQSGQVVASLVPDLIKITEQELVSYSATSPVSRTDPTIIPSFDDSSLDGREEVVLADESYLYTNELNNAVDEPRKTNRDWTTMALVALLGFGSLAVLLKPLPKTDSLDRV